MSNFLGKSNQSSKPDFKKMRSQRIAQKSHHRLKPSVYFALILGLASSVYALNASGIKLSQLTPSDKNSSQKEITLASVANINEVSQIRSFAATTAPTCDNTFLQNIYKKESAKSISIFPLFPVELFDGTSCSPAYWNLGVGVYLAYRILKLLNIIAFVLAIIFTVIAGLYYIGGFANEANAKKGKTILTATYVGLVIVLAARVIVFGTFSYITNKKVGTDVGGNGDNPAILQK